LDQDERVHAVVQLPLLIRNIEPDGTRILSEEKMISSSDPSLENHKAFAQLLSQLIPRFSLNESMLDSKRNENIEEKQEINGAQSSK
jgi:hypothetical protein